MIEIQNLSKQIDFDNLTYFLRATLIEKDLSILKVHELFIKKIKDGYTKLEKKKKNKKK